MSRVDPGLRSCREPGEDLSKLDLLWVERFGGDQTLKLRTCMKPQKWSGRDVSDYSPHNVQQELGNSHFS